MAKIGVLGFAHGHVFAFGSKWLREPELNATIVKGFDHNQERGKNGCKQLNCEYTADMNEILEDSTIDSIVITSETYYHADYVEAAAKAGKKIICYKPLALNIKQADRIVEAVDKYGIDFTMAWQMRTDPQNIHVKQMLNSGEFGKIYSIRRRHGLSTQKFHDFESSWHVSPQLNRDIFADDASHAMDFIYWLMGMPETVTATLSTLMNPKITNDNAIAVYKYPSGALAEVSCNFVCLAAENALEVQCEKGTILINFGDLPSANMPHNKQGLKWYKDGDDDWTRSEILSPAAHGERIANQAKPLADFLNGKTGPIATAKEARDVLKMVLACYVSNEAGQRVQLDDDRICKME